MKPFFPALLRCSSPMRGGRGVFLLGVLALSFLGLAPLADAKPAALQKELTKAAGLKVSLSIGAPNRGSQSRAKRIKTSRELGVLKKSANNTYAHPSLVLMLSRSAKQIAKSFPGSKLVLGDLSSKEGGSLVGHHSHQSGRDADVVFFARDKHGKRVTPQTFVAYGADGRALDGSGLTFDDERNWQLVVAWAKDSRADLQYIFVSRTLKARLLAFASRYPDQKKLIGEIAPLFLEPENAEPHNDHFHVRIRCPKDQEKICRDA